MGPFTWMSKRHLNISKILILFSKAVLLSCFYLSRLRKGRSPTCLSQKLWHHRLVISFSQATQKTHLNLSALSQNISRIWSHVTFGYQLGVKQNHLSHGLFAIVFKLFCLLLSVLLWIIFHFEARMMLLKMFNSKHLTRAWHDEDTKWSSNYSNTN